MALPVAVLLAALLSPKVAAITLWVGLGLLTLTLAALMVTRWGQTQSIAKCAVLSVWAHVLLAVYATTVDIVFTPPAGHGHEGTIYIQGAEAVATSADGMSEPADKAGALKPWERFADTDTLHPAGNNPSPTRRSGRACQCAAACRSNRLEFGTGRFASETLTDADVRLPQPKPLRHHRVEAETSCHDAG